MPIHVYMYMYLCICVRKWIFRICTLTNSNLTSCGYISSVRSTNSRFTNPLGNVIASMISISVPSISYCIMVVWLVSWRLVQESMISITVLSMACCTGIGVRVFWAPAPHPRARLIPRSARTLCRGSGEGSGQALSHYASRRGQQDQAGTCSAATAGTKEARTRLTLLFACTAVCGAARRGRAHVDSRARCAWSWPQRNMDCPTNAAAGAGSVARWPPSATAGAAAASISITAQAAACVCIGNASVPFCTNHFFHNTLDTRQRHIRKYSNTLGSTTCYTANFLLCEKPRAIRWFSGMEG